MDTFAKLYDSILCKRLEQWFSPDREQAGAQKGRGCTEHLVTLRLLISYARHKMCKLFIAYIDFSKAYDRVPRKAMIKSLMELGCGLTILTAIAMMYSDTTMML